MTHVGKPAARSLLWSWRLPLQGEIPFNLRGPMQQDQPVIDVISAHLASKRMPSSAGAQHHLVASTSSGGKFRSVSPWEKRQFRGWMQQDQPVIDVISAHLASKSGMLL